MRNFFRYVTIILLTLGSSVYLKGENTDFRIRARAGVKFNIVENLSNTSDLEIRTKEFSSRLDAIRLNTYFGYKFNKYFSMGAGYAFISVPKNETFTLSHRYWVDATGSISFSNFTLSLRERFQQTFAVGKSAILLRSELKAQYTIEQSIFKPFISCEPHIYMFNSSKGAKEIRFNLGTNIAINKSNDLQIFGRYTYTPDSITLVGVEIKTPDYFVLGINYYFKF